MFPIPEDTYHRAYFLSDEHEFDETYTRVPENSVYIEEWVDENGTKLSYVQYEGEEIKKHENPFKMTSAKRPWVWIGDASTDIDLTKTFDKFLIPGNVIELDLVLKLIQVNENTHLQYMKPDMTFENFPGDGILIESNDAE